jgi:hypothetical protein
VFKRADEYLLSAGDQEAITGLLAADPPRSSSAWKSIHDMVWRVYQLTVQEARALSRSSGLQPRPNHGFISSSDAWALLSPERRAIPFTMNLSGWASSNGLGQCCADFEDEINYASESVKLIVPEPLATTLADYLDAFARALAELTATGTVSHQTMGPYDPVAYRTLEDAVWNTDWTMLRIRHVMRHPHQFFR